MSTVSDPVTPNAGSDRRVHKRFDAFEALRVRVYFPRDGSTVNEAFVGVMLDFSHGGMRVAFADGGDNAKDGGAGRALLARLGREPAIVVCSLERPALPLALVGEVRWAKPGQKAGQLNAELNAGQPWAVEVGLKFVDAPPLALAAVDGLIAKVAPEAQADAQPAPRGRAFVAVALSMAIASGGFAWLQAGRRATLEQQLGRTSARAELLSEKVGALETSLRARTALLNARGETEAKPAIAEEPRHRVMALLPKGAARSGVVVSEARVVGTTLELGLARMPAGGDACIVDVRVEHNGKSVCEKKDVEVERGAASVSCAAVPPDAVLDIFIEPGC